MHKPFDNRPAAFDQSEILSAFSPDETLTVIAANQIPILIPREIYDDDKKLEYFRVQNGKTPNETVHIDCIDDYVALYHLPYNIQDSIDRLPYRKTYLHETTLLAGFLKEHGDNNAVLISNNETFFDTIVVGNRKLQLVNRFPFNKPEDIIYYILYMTRLYKLTEPTAYILVHTKSGCNVADFLRKHKIKTEML